MSEREKISCRWLILDIMTLAYLLVFISVSLLIEPYWIQIDSYLNDALGLQFRFVYGIVLLASLGSLYALSLVVIGLASIKLKKEFSPMIINKILPSILLIVFSVFLMLLGVLWGDDAVLIVSALEYLSPVLYASLIFSVSLFLILNVHSIMRVVNDLREKTIPYSSHKGISTLLILILCGCIYVAPILFPPSNVVPLFLPTKPSLIGHRCASSLGPENTIETAETVLSFGIVGIEVDIQISIDGIPFLLHDSTLERTTNVDTLFPERADQRAANFLISEIRQLDAGSWFVESDPFGTIASGLITSTQAENYRGAQIPTLVEILNFVEQEDLILNTDFKYPPSNHPFYDTYLDICFSIIHDAQIDDQIWITSYNQETLDEIKSQFPDMHTVLSVEPSTAPNTLDFIEMEFDMINTHHGLANGLFIEYNLQDISVNAWTVNSITRFSQLWILGVDFVTTDYPQDFHTLEYPFWIMRYPAYASVWIVIDIICMLLIRRRYLRLTSIDSHAQTSV